MQAWIERQLLQEFFQPREGHGVIENQKSRMLPAALSEIEGTPHQCFKIRSVHEPSSPLGLPLPAQLYRQASFARTASASDDQHREQFVRIQPGVHSALDVLLTHIVDELAYWVQGVLMFGCIV